MKKKLLFWFYFILFVVLGIYISTNIFIYFKTQKIKKINIVNYYNNQNIDILKNITNKYINTQTDTKEIFNNLIKYSWIKDLIIKKQINGTLDIKIKPHINIAIMEFKDNFYYITNENIIFFDYKVVNNNSNYILFKDIIDESNNKYELDYDINSFLKKIKIISNNISYIERIENRRFNIITKNNIKIMLPEENINKALDKIIKLNEEFHILSKKIKIIDIRDINKIIIIK